MGTHQNLPPLPFSPRFEMAGIVTESKSDDFKEGDRVLASMHYGAYQEFVDVLGCSVEPVPESISYEKAAAILIAYVSAIYRAKLKANETLLAFGATGGVGSRLVEIGSAKGAKVIAVHSKDTKKEYLRLLGAKELINNKTEDITARIQEITGGDGVDVIADTVDGDMFSAA